MDLHHFCKTGAKNFQCPHFKRQGYAFHMNLRAKVGLELGILAALAAAFIVMFPHRHPAVDISLALLALVGIAASASYTRNCVWAASPSPVAEPRSRRGWFATLWITIPVAVVFLGFGAVVAYRASGWQGVCDRILNWRVLAVFGGYLVWALLQQTLLEFYLLGRLLILFPRTSLPFVVTGICFGLVHLPDYWTASVTVVAGAVWSILYFRYRALLPLALSHAMLGTAFYYGLFGHDLSAEWSAFVQGS